MIRPWRDRMGVMGLLRLFGLSQDDSSRKAKVHDFTIEFPDRKLSQVKFLDEGARVFLVGYGATVFAGDVIVLRPAKARRTASCRYVLGDVQSLGEGNWRAYGRLSR